MIEPRIKVPKEELAAFCRKWKIAELALFGSVLREDFRPDSDIDVLVTFEENHGHGLTEFIGMQDELEALLGRKVDFVTRGALESSRNFLRRAEIFGTAQVIYDAA